MTSSIVSGRATSLSSVIIRKSLLPTAESCRRDLAASVADQTAPHLSNVFDGLYFETRQNPLYCNDSEQLDDDEHQDDQS